MMASARVSFSRPHVDAQDVHKHACCALAHVYELDAVLMCAFSVRPAMYVYAVKLKCTHVS